MQPNQDASTWSRCHHFFSPIVNASSSMRPLPIVPIHANISLLWRYSKLHVGLNGLLTFLSHVMLLNPLFRNEEAIEKTSVLIPAFYTYILRMNWTSTTRGTEIAGTFSKWLISLGLQIRDSVQAEGTLPRDVAGRSYSRLLSWPDICSGYKYD